ncbi:hypothetical protein HPB47_027939 [Ixodes persulcatus]|uniref:Uncharacterized protein n=1 Tax=Ixodes persulcatus TaxID=34615 RepID=A0AC60PUN8_IXOPE|nr:hypothetical protein HPB47_027939 [Ixodes persulcatus]
MADNGGCASTPTAKRKKQGARCSDRQLDMLIDYMFSNRVLVRAATESTLTTAERTALWDVITGRLNAEGPAWKERVEWKNLWNARVCAARKHDGLLAVEAARTGGGANPVGPLNEVETRILAIVGRDSSRGCGGLRPRQSLPSSSEASPPLPAELLYQEESLGAPPEVPLQPASQPAPSGGGQPAADCATLDPPRTQPRSDPPRRRNRDEPTVADILAVQRRVLEAQQETAAAVNRLADASILIIVYCLML